MARHLVMTGRLLDDEPEQALAQARAARAAAARIGVVREAVGLAAYASEKWTEALAELRAARRITGRPDHLAVMADCERALGRPERALGYADDPEVPGLPQDERVELIIVLAGARADMDQQDAAVLTLQEPAQRTTAGRPWAVRLWYAYADALLGAGREELARDWFSRVADADADGQTDAVDRLLALDGVLLADLDGERDGEDEHVPDPELAEYITRTYAASAGAAGSETVDASSRRVEVQPRKEGASSERVSERFPGADSVTPAAPRAALTPPFATGEESTDREKDATEPLDGASRGRPSNRPGADVDSEAPEPLRLFD